MYATKNMEITIDTSAILAVCLNEQSRDEMIRMAEGATLVCPVSVHWEIGNALSAMLRRNRITLKDAKACVAAYEKIPIRRLEVDLVQSLAYCNQFGMFAYDSYLIVCALQSGTPLLSLDAGLKKIATSLSIETLGGN